MEHGSDGGEVEVLVSPRDRHDLALSAVRRVAECVLAVFHAADDGDGVGVGRFDVAQAILQHVGLLAVGQLGGDVALERLVLLAPGEGAAVPGVLAAAEAGFVAVVDRRAAGQRAQQVHAHLVALHRQGVLVRGEADPLLLVLGQVDAAAVDQHVQRAGTVVAADEVHQRIAERRRVHLRLMLHQAHEGVGVDPAGGEVDQRGAQGIVHDGVEGVAGAVAAHLAVGHLVGGVLPDLAQDDGFRVGLAGGAAELAQEVHGQLVRHVQTPAARALADPPGHDAFLVVEHKLLVRRVVLAQLRQAHDAPPGAVVIRVVLEGEPVEIGAGGTLVRAQGGVVAEVVEVDAVLAGVGEDAVQQHAHAEEFCLLAQDGELLLRAAQRVDFAVIARVVAVVGAGAEDRVEVDDVHAEGAQIGELLADAAQVAAEEVQLLVPSAAHVAHGDHLLVPGLVDVAVLAVILGRRLAAGETVGENLIDVRAVEVGGGVVIRVEDGDLEGFRLAALPDHALAAQLVRRVAVDGGMAVGAVDDEAVPVQPGLVREGDGGLPDVAFGAAHGVAQLLVLPGAQDDGGGLVAPEADGDRAAGGRGALGLAEEGLVGVVEHHGESVQSWRIRGKPHPSVRRRTATFPKGEGLVSGRKRFRDP